MIDGTMCLWAALLLFQPPNWVPGISILDDVVCHVWNGQFIYWCSVQISGRYSLLLPVRYISLPVVILSISTIENLGLTI